MNWIDFFIGVVLVVAIGWGYKNGLFKSISTFAGLIIAVVFALNHADWLALHLGNKFNFSPSIRYFFCCVVLFLVMVVVFKIIGHYFYKMIKLTPLRYPDKIGGGVFGALKGLIFLSMIFLMFIFFPGFHKYNDSVDKSVMAPTIRKVVPMTFELTKPFHPNSGPFLEKILVGILGPDGKKYAKDPESLLGNSEILGFTYSDIRVLASIDSYFGDNIEVARKEAEK